MDTRSPRPQGRTLRRLWDLPLGAHLAVLAVILVAAAAVVGTGASFMPDEGAAIIQARSLSQGRGWIVEHPLPEVDAAGRNYPLELAAEGPKGTAPFAKHPVYALLLAGADRLGGTGAMVGLSLLGTLVAAGLAGVLAGRLSPSHRVGGGLARPALWATGAGSPLLFDGYLVIAHTLAAAAAAAAVLAAVSAVERRSWRRGLLVAPPVAAAVLLRNEGLFLALGLAAAAAVVVLRRPTARAAGWAIGAAAAGAAATAHLGERVWVGQIVGTGYRSVSAPAGRGSDGFLAGRLDGFLLTWLTPGYVPAPRVTVPLLVMTVALAAAAFAVRRRLSGRIVLSWAGLAAACGLAALVANRDTVVPGLLVVFPLAVVGLVLLARALLDEPDVEVALVTGAVFCLGVLATQYSTGGTGEWGGRYFALILPVVVPALLLAVARRAGGLPRPVRTGAGIALVTCSLGVSGMALVSLRANHQSKLEVISAIQRAGREATPGDGGAPVVVGTGVGLPRQAWPTFEHHRWLLSPSSQLRPLVAGLRSSGIDRFVLVTPNRGWDQPALAGLDVVVAERAESLDLDVLVLAGRRP